MKRCRSAKHADTDRERNGYVRVPPGSERIAVTEAGHEVDRDRMRTISQRVG
jgi:hypothetical protein